MVVTGYQGGRKHRPQDPGLSLLHIWEAVLSPGTGATGLGPAKACQEASAGASICVASSPAKKLKWHFCFTAVAATGDLTERLLLALMLSLIPAWGDHVTSKVGDVPILGSCCWLSVAKAQVGMLLCVLPVPWSGSFGGAETHTGLGMAL